MADGEARVVRVGLGEHLARALGEIWKPRDEIDLSVATMLPETLAALSQINERKLARSSRMVEDGGFALRHPVDNERISQLVAEFYAPDSLDPIWPDEWGAYGVTRDSAIIALVTISNAPHEILLTIMLP